MNKKTVYILFVHRDGKKEVVQVLSDKTKRDAAWDAAMSLSPDATMSIESHEVY